ncbi:MAG TPA: hypothetical protein VG538_18940 [Vicinamibacterales bacterium]|nr:hypothetical protein [Vicinamibacterales bacterium]
MTADRVLVRRGFLRWAAPVLVLTLIWAAWNAWDFIEGRRLKNAVDAIRRSGGPTSVADLYPQVLLGQQAADDAAPYYAAAAALSGAGVSTGDASSISRVIVAVTKGEAPHADDLARIPALIEQRADALRMLDAATARTFKGFPSGTSYGYRRAEMLELLRLAGARTIAMAADGDSSRAAVSLAAEIRLVLGPNPPVRPWVAPTFVPTVANVVAQLRWIIDHGTPDAASLAALAEAFATADDDDALARQFETNRAFELESFAQRYRPVVNVARPFPAGLLVTAMWATASRPIATQALLHRLAGYDALVAASRLPWPVRLDRIAALNGPQPLGDIPSSRTTAAAAQVTALVRAARIIVAVERFRAANATTLLTSIDALVPTYLPSAPIDPYSGEPMRYRAQPSGYVIYSVGPDRKDDGGDTKTDVSALIAPKTEPRR